MILSRFVALGLVMTWSVTAVAQTEWVLHEGNPVIPAPEADEWPGYQRWIESVVVVDGTYHMFFTGTAVMFWVDHSIGHATSQDGLSWTMDQSNPVLLPETEGDWEVTSLASLAVIHEENEFVMWYGGVDPSGRCQVGRATSPDGSNWNRYAGNPVFAPGPEGSFDDGLVLPNTVLRRGGLYHMWYGGIDAPTVFSEVRIGYATSPDGVSWTRHPEPILDIGDQGEWDSYQVYGPNVIFDGASFHMWFTGVKGHSIFMQTILIGYATSPDGIDWTKDPSNPIEELGEFVAQPRVLLHVRKREFEMFYNGEAIDDCSVNRATSDCGAIAPPRRPTGRISPR